MIAAGNLDAAVKVGAGIHAVDELLELVSGREVERIDIRVAPGDKAGKHLQHVDLIRCVIIQNRVLLKITLLLVVGETCEHGAVVHVMAIQNRVIAREIRLADRVHEDTATGVFGSVQGMMEVILVVSALQNRITDDGIRAVDPADDLGILREQ